MGSICSRGNSSYGNADSQREKESSKSSRHLFAPSGIEENVAEAGVAANGGKEGLAHLIAKQLPQNNLVAILSDEGEKKTVIIERPTNAHHQRRATVDIGVQGAQLPLSRIVSMPNAVEGEQVAAGWPSWLTAVAGEAIKGWVPRRAESFEKLDKIGQGTYSSVYKARDLETDKIVAMKKVRFVNMDPESVRFMAREIHVLRRLDHPNVMKLEGLVTSRMSCSLYLVFEYMEHDLTGLAATPSIKFTEPQIKCYMQQLLRGLEHCHSRGVLHRDIKGSNLLIDHNGVLKIGDFGLATFFRPDLKQPLTSRVVTLWYRPPELLLGATEYGVAVDLWGTGCILAELFAGKPIMAGRTEVEQLHKIFKLCGSPSEEFWRKSRLPHATIFKPQHPYKRCVSETFKNFPSSALSLTDVLLAIEPADRGTAASALKSDFFSTEPLPCDPSSLPKYPPSKEFDAKLRDETARRQIAEAVKGYRDESARSSRKSKAMTSVEINAELQKRQGQSNPKSSSEKYDPQEDGGSGFPIEPPRGTARNIPWNMKEDETAVVRGQSFGSSQNFMDLKTQRLNKHQAAVNLSNFSGSMNAQSMSQYGKNGDGSAHPHLKSRYNHLDDVDPSESHELSYYLLDRPTSHRKGEWVSGKESAVATIPKNRIHHSGPLLPSQGNIEDMLKEHERHIQEAVRKARLDKAKTKKKYGDKRQSELLYYGRIVR